MERKAGSRKLHLSVDDLRVETFATLPAAQARGTVRAHATWLWINCYDTETDCPSAHNTDCTHCTQGYCPPQNTASCDFEC